MTTNQIADKMIEYAVINWKYQFYECERGEARESLTSPEGIAQFIENLNEDLENEPRREDAKEMLTLIKSIQEVSK